MRYEKIYSPTGDISITTFGGLNRRIRCGTGEFSDMENITNEAHPCIRSAKGAERLSDAPPSALKMIIPKRLNSDITGFSGVTDSGIYINGEKVYTAWEKIVDAVDYNGTIITMPVMKGYDYLAKKSVTPYRIGEPMVFGKVADTVNGGYIPTIVISNKTGEWYNNVFTAHFAVGDRIVLEGFSKYADNQNYNPATPDEIAVTNRPVSITIKKIERSSGELNTFVTIYVMLLNSRGEEIQWPVTGDFTESGYMCEFTPYGACGCVAHNRMWTCSYNGEEIYASALGKPFKFSELKGLNSDSWTVTVGTPGLFTGIASWQNRVVAFKQDIIHIIYGTTPSAFSLERTYTTGCIDKFSIAEVGGRLIWLYHDGFYAYSGGRPVRISDKLNTKYVSCKAFSDGRRYYARCIKEDGSGEFIVYDTELGVWNRLTDTGIVCGDYYNGKVFVCDGVAMYTLFSGECGDFYAETGEMTFDLFDDKSILYIRVRCIIESGFLNIYTSVNNSAWIEHRGIDKTGRHKLPIRYMPGDVLRLRFEGSGDVCITELGMKCKTR